MPVDSYTKLLLHCNGSDTSTTFTDDGDTGHTMIAEGNAQIDTDQQKFGTASGLFDGTGDYIRTGDHADWDFSNADFTIDFWLRPNVWGDANYKMIGDTVLDTPGASWVIWFNGGASQNLSFRYTTDGSTLISKYVSATLSAGTWFHVAVVRNGADLKFFLDGTQQGATQNVSTDTIANFMRNLEIGGDTNNALYYNGWIDELRVSKGIARWTSNFTPPTQEYPIPPPVENAIFFGANF